MRKLSGLFPGKFKNDRHVSLFLKALTQYVKEEDDHHKDGKCCKKKLIIHPDNKFLRIWEFIMMMYFFEY